MSKSTHALYNTGRYDIIIPQSMTIIGSKIMSKAVENARQKQFSIVQAAKELFLKQGFAATGMDAVAAWAGVTKQTVYRYFSSKEKLFLAVMENIREKEPPPYVFGDLELKTELGNFGRDLLAFHLTPAALGIYKIMLQEGGQEGLIKPFMKTGPNRVMKSLGVFLQKRFPKLKEVEFYAGMFASMVLVPRNQLIMQGKGRITLVEQQSHVSKVVSLFLEGIQT